mmetsp:Transcript_78525/g.155564  ORF Transcript_78525/g.155564 Transcript_78525/m.155564 type:complete len:343 (-) Transcript_78525:59-1087(-)
MKQLVLLWFCHVVAGNQRVPAHQTKHSHSLLDARGSDRQLWSPWQPLNVVHDAEPLELDFSQPVRWIVAGLKGAVGNPPGFEANPRNGTPWFRWKRVGDRGQSSHGHFGGLSATGDFNHDVLEAHNAVRSRAGLPLLTENENLTALAAARADELANGGCYIRHSSTSTRWDVSGFLYVGENLYKVINMKPTGVDVVDAWYAEIGDYNYGAVGNRCTKERCAGRASPPCTLGHFTQVMWARTTEIGCARAQCPGRAKPTFIALCNYGPGGNIVGRLPFSGQVASALDLPGDPCPRPEGAPISATATAATAAHSTAWRRQASPVCLSVMAILFVTAASSLAGSS